MKINNLRLKGFRGVRRELNILLNGKSIVLYGDNGTGKSSITDSIEWFFSNKIDHLSSTEINLKSATRNYFAPEEERTEVEINFNNNSLDATKGFLSNDAPKFSKIDDDFKKFVNDSQKENFILRHRDLGNFILSPKGDKLKGLLDIIGFSEVTKKKELLGKVYRSINTEIKKENFENQINTQKSTLISKLSANVTSEANLVESVNEKIKNLKLEIKATSLADIDTVLEKLKKPHNENILREYEILNKAKTEIETIKSEKDFLNTTYTNYFNEFDLISKDVDGIMQTFLAELLDTGKTILKKYHKADSCPLCLQPKSNLELQAELEVRLLQIEEASKKKVKFDNARKLLESVSIERLDRLNIDYTKYFEDQKPIIDLENLKEKFKKFQENAKIRVVSNEKLLSLEGALFQDSDFEFVEMLALRIKQIDAIFKKDSSTQIFADISAAKDAFINIKKFEKAREQLENQRKSLELIYNHFIKVLKEGLENFINSFSAKINEYYQFMNPEEPFQNLRLKTIGDEDNLDGLTIEFNFKDKIISPPQALFSESHLNCFGISFFLASIDAFGKNSKFIVFDDVISSFDSTHRKRFSELLFEKSKQFQIILLTHEFEWFKNFVKPQAKGKGWLIKEIAWNDEDGTVLKLSSNGNEERINELLAEGNTDVVGNMMRIFCENKFKQIAHNLQAKFAFKYGDDNEHRMLDELFARIRSQINGQSPQLKRYATLFDRIQNSSLLTNSASHDNTLIFKIADLKAMWADFKEFINLFYCQEDDCKKQEVAMKFYDSVEKTIRCGCGKTKYEWKDK
ncbi:AAA family ATPase [Chryseobacterium gotjawalense]|uniref:AAA family ATPase n=1 Tax=Chryseobacterium gotjawalense TaxID=3042315 RepID=A0ABY8RCR3_9FLAO|nr:AAA family ATPase [Chryseobacterium sp. wdc7]WHF50997.1 AAA family ATPase [Chryseobacterium sp. wdc7]